MLCYVSSPAAASRQVVLNTATCQIYTFVASVKTLKTRMHNDATDSLDGETFYTKFSEKNQ